MRHPRLKPQGRDMFYHVYNRVAGTKHDLPFGDVEKEHFIRLLARLTAALEEGAGALRLVCYRRLRELVT